MRWAATLVIGDLVCRAPTCPHSSCNNAGNLAAKNDRSLCRIAAANSDQACRLEAARLLVRRGAAVEKRNRLVTDDNAGTKNENRNNALSAKSLKKAGCAGSLERTSLSLKFPVLQGIYRELAGLSPIHDAVGAWKGAQHQQVEGHFPARSEQGIRLTETGKGCR